MPTEQKVEIVSNVKNKYTKAAGIYFTDYLGLNVSDITKLRKKFYDEGIEFLVVKNTLAQLAFEDFDNNGLSEIFQGPTAIAFGYDDPTAPARVLKEFKKDHDLPEIKALIFEGKLLDGSSFKGIADLPSREVLLAQFLSALNSPLAKIMATLNSPMVNLINTLKSLKETKQA